MTSTMGRSSSCGDAKLGIGFQTDQLGWGDGLRVSGKLKFIRIGRAKRMDGNGPLAGAHLGSHQSPFIDRDWNRAFDRGNLPTGRQNPSQLFLATLTRNGHFDVGSQPNRDAVFDQPVNLYREQVLVGRLAARTFQPHFAVGVPVRYRNFVAFDDK